jgi:hypothetical protein
MVGGIYDYGNFDQVKVKMAWSIIIQIFHVFHTKLKYNSLTHQAPKELYSNFL